MTASFSVKVTAAIGLGLAMLIVIGLVNYRSTLEYYDADREMRRMITVLEHLEAIRRDTERAEVVQLRYQLTGDPADSDEFRAMTYRVRGAIEQLGGLLAVSEQKFRLGELERTISARFDVLGEAIRLRGREGAATELLVNERGVESGRGTERILEAIVDRERQMVRAQVGQTEADTTLALGFTLWGNALAVTLLLWTILVINRYERDRRRVEGELRGAEERLALALKGSNSAVWDWNLKRGEVYLSAGWSRMLGAAEKDATSTPVELLALVHPDDVKHVQKVIQDALDGATPEYNEEHRVRRADGEWIWVLSRGRVVQRDERGQPLRMAGTNNDITERKRAEETLKQHDARLRLALETAGMAGWDWDIAADEFVWHDSPQHLAGPAPPGGYPSLRDMVHPADLLRFVRTLESVARTGEGYRDEFRISRADGRVAWVLARGRLERDAEGKVTRVIGVVQDISEIKDAAQTLLDNERQLRLLTNAVPAVITYQDLGECIRFCNRAMERMLGMQPEAVIGRSMRDVFGEVTYKQLRPFVLRALAGEEVHFERVQMRPQGPVDLSVTYVPRHNERGEVEGFYALATDISDLKRLDRMKSEFVSTVSHELRTPLTSIRGSLGLLAGGVAGALPDKARQFIEIAKNNCERLIRLINDILDMEKIESGKMTFQLRVLDLMDLIDQVIKANESFAAQHKVRLQVVTARPGTKVHADSDRLAQVLTNFVSNACKFSPAESTVDISVATDAERVRVGVTDHGPGISEEFCTRIFQKFSQADSSDGRQKGGTGLGLSISKAIVEGLGGEIGLDTEVGKGTTFHFTLPEWHEPATAGATGP